MASGASSSNDDLLDELESSNGKTFAPDGREIVSEKESGVVTPHPELPASKEEQSHSKLTYTDTDIMTSLTSSKPTYTDSNDGTQSSREGPSFFGIDWCVLQLCFARYARLPKSLLLLLLALLNKRTPF